MLSHEHSRDECLNDCLQKHPADSRASKWLSAIVVSLLLAACSPVQKAQAQATVPNAGEWAQTPNTIINNAVGSQRGVQAVKPWVGGAYNETTHEFWLIRPGGHMDGNDPFSLFIDLDNPVWQTYEGTPTIPLTGHTDNNGLCPFPAYGPPTQHTYDGLIWLGGTRYFHSGSPGGCNNGFMAPANTAWVLDTSVAAPGNWTEYQSLRPFVLGFAEVKNGIMYIIGNGKWAKIDAATMGIISSGNLGGVVVNGVQQTFHTSFGSDNSAASIVGNLFCIIDHSRSEGDCSNINGSVNGSNNDSFGRFRVRTIPSFASRFSEGLAPAPDGQRFVVWAGDNEVYTWDPTDNQLSTPADVWTQYTPATGPAPYIVSGQTVGRPYSKWFYASHIDSFCGYTNPTQGLWCYRLPDAQTINQPPVAVNDTFSGSEDGAAVSCNPLSNDTDPENGALTATLLKGPYAGTLSLSSNGTCTYTQPADFNGQTDFEYRVTDSGGLSDIGLSTINISAVNDTPIAADDSFSTDNITPITASIVTNDFDVEGATLSATPTSSVAHGDLQLASTGTFTYTPDTGYVGTDSFTYQVSDGVASSSAATATFTITAPSGGGSGSWDIASTSFSSLCSLSETLLCDGMDNTTLSGPAITQFTTLQTMSQASVAPFGSWRRSFALTTSPGAVQPAFDPSMGEDGSLKFTIASQSSGGASGQYTVNASPHNGTNSQPIAVGAVEGETIVTRVKIYLSCDMLYTDCNPLSPTYKVARRHFETLVTNPPSPGGQKFLNDGEQDYLNANGNIVLRQSGQGMTTPVTHNGRQNGAFTSYLNSANIAIEVNDTIVSGDPANDTDRQPYRHCYWGDIVPGGSSGNCVMIESDQWVTMQTEIHFGHCGSTVINGGVINGNSHFTLKIANEGQPFVTAIDTDLNLGCGSAPFSPTPRLGKIWITPYNTNKSPAEVHPTGYMWADDLWVGKF